MILPHKYNRYVEGLDSKDAKVSLFKGKCSLNHLKLKPTVLHDFGLPARVRYVSLRLKERCRIFLDYISQAPLACARAMMHLRACTCACASCYAVPILQSYTSEIQNGVFMEGL